MSEAFDPYRKWLGIPPKDQPPNHYRLLGIAHFEDDPDVIENAASRQLAHVRTFQSGKHSADSQRILNELTAAKLCLLQPEKKAAYDVALRQRLAASGQLSSEAPLEEEAYPPPPPEDFRPGNRWRTGTDIEPPIPSVGPAPVPIPMPPAAAPPVAISTTGGPVVRRSSHVRGKRSNSGLPMMLILGSIGVLAVAIIFAVIMAMQPPATSKDPGKTKSHTTDKSGDRPSPKTSLAGGVNSPAGTSPRPRVNPTPATKTEPTANRLPNLNRSVPAALGVPQDELKQARDALARRHDGDFTLHVSQAEYLIGQQKPANANELKAEVEHLRELNKLLSQFWQAVRNVPKGERFKFRKHEIELVSREGEQLTYKIDGREEVAAIKKLPARVATSIAYRAFGNDNLSGKIALVAFLTVDADALSDQGSRRLATKLYEDIRKAGEENHSVLARELGKEPQPPPMPDDDFSPPVILGGGASSPSPSSSSTAGEKSGAAQGSFDPAKLKEAREKFDRRFRERFVLALEQPGLARPLYQDLLEAAEGDETGEFKAHLLLQAGELAANLGDSGGIVKVSEQLSKLSGENALEIQNRLFSRCKLEGESAAKDLLKHAKAASAAAEQGNNLHVAIELAKTARKAVDKLSLPSEAFELDNRIQELQALQEKERIGRK